MPGERAPRSPSPPPVPPLSGELSGERDDGAGESFDELLRQVSRAAPIQPEELAAAIARGHLVGRTVGRFRIFERLGAGGMGVVYGAEDTKLGRRVALKVLAPRATPESVAGAGGVVARRHDETDLLLREARAAAAINHPNVAAIYEAGEADGVAHIAMEYVDGVTLRGRLERGTLSPLDVIRYARQIADGLSKAHERGVVHRDLKPDNVMIDQDDRIKILDFGLARPAPIAGGPSPADSASRLAADEAGAHPPSSRRGRARAGTPAYMSPEQVRGERVDARSDVFSFGVLVREALTGVKPLDRTRAPSESLERVRESDATTIRDHASPAFCAVVDRCLALSPADRFASGAELAKAIDGALATTRTSDRTKRRFAWVIAAGFGAMLLLLGAHALRGRAPISAHATSSAPAEGAHPVRRLTANIPENPVLGAALSPDGATLAFIDTTGLHLAKVGGATVPFDPGVRGAPQIVAWFPDGVHLALCTAAPGAADEELWVVSRTKDSAPRLLGHGLFTGLALSPDGTRIAYAAVDTVGWLAASESGGPAEQHQLTKKEGCFITEVAWSPDAGRIAYASECFDSASPTAIETVALAGGSPSVVVADPHIYNGFVRAAGVVWSTAGEIVYPRMEWLPAEPGSNLWSVKVNERSGAATAPPRPITSWVGVGAAALSATASMSHVAFIRFEMQSDVYVGTLSNGGRALSLPRRLTLSDRNERPTAWSKDGTGVYFFTDASGNFDIFYQPIDGGAARSFAAEPAWETSSQLSPDGESLLYWRFPPLVAGDPFRPEIVRRPIGGGDVTHVLTTETFAQPVGAGPPAPREMRMRCPRQPGLSCVISEKVGEALVFKTFDPASGSGKEIFRVEHPPAGANIWDISPDGMRLAIPRGSQPMLIQSIAGARASSEVVVPGGCDPVTPTWSADGRGIFLSVDCNADDSTFRLYYVGLDGVASLLWKDPSLYILEAEASPDGERLAIAVKHTDDDVWMVDGLGAERGR